ncbi:MAG: energy transducer TonB [Desulfovibrio sp.]|nr:energy transducer TonB [Desulfovibrio sp.]
MSLSLSLTAGKSLSDPISVLAAFASIALHGGLIFGMAGFASPDAMPGASAAREISIVLASAGAAQTAANPSGTSAEAQAAPDQFSLEDTSRENAPENVEESARPQDADETALRPENPDGISQKQNALAAKSKRPSTASSHRANAQARSGGDGKDAPARATSPAPMGSGFNPKPLYPELARRRGQEGLVQLRANVDEQGQLQDLVVQKSSGFPLLDQAALDAVGKWSFLPGQYLGQAVSGTVLVPIEFRLSGPAARH